MADLNSVAMGEGAPPPPTRPREQSEAGQEIGAVLAALEDLDLHELRMRWRNVFRSMAPAHLPRSLLLRIVAYKIQANAFGDLDRETARYLDGIARDYERRRSADGRRSSKNPPPIPRVPDRQGLKPGTMLAREHGGVLYRVIVGEGGFSWNGASYKSLSEVARAITGTNWNGPRFFGLRNSKAAQHSVAGPGEARP